MRKPLKTLLLLVIIPSLMLAQGTFKVSGKVTDATGDALIGASVMIQSLHTGAATDLNGKYSFDVPKEIAKGQKVELSASFVNYKKKVATVVLNGNDITENFILAEDPFHAEEVVVTGIASKTSKEVAEVAVSRLNVGDLTQVQSYQSLPQLFNGKVAGVNIQTASGNVGGGWRFFVRGGGGLNGNEQPIIYLDGTRLDNTEIYGWGVGGQGTSSLANLNPNDIENVEILKGPAASSSYGTNASNGVVLITTKRGKLTSGLGKGMNIDYSFNYGINTQSFKYGENWLNKDRINAVLGAPGFIQEHSIQASGGNQLLKYFASFQSRNERGLIPDQNYMERKSLRFNITAKPNETFDLEVSSNYIWNKIARPNDDNNTWGWMLNALSYYPAYLNTDSVALSKEQDFLTINQFIGSVKSTWRPIQDFELNGTFAVDYKTAYEDQYYPWGYKYGSNLKGYRYIYDSNVSRFSYNLNAKYYFSFFEKLNLTATVGTQLNDRIGTSLDGGGQYFNHPNITTIQTGDPNNKTGPDNSYSYSRDAGIYAETNFNWDNTYFWTFMVRRDYANAFGTEAPNIIYPKASLSVRLDRLGYFTLPAMFDRLKLRAAYGESGTLPGRLDGIPLTWTASAGANGVGIIGNSLGNPQVEPERIKEFEIGLETEMIKMVDLEFNYYHTDASKSIVYSTLSPSMGFGGLSYPFNIGRVAGHGFEAVVQFYPIRSSNYDLSISANWNYQTSEILDLGNTTELTNDQNVEKVGWKKHEFYAQKTTTPIYNSTGQLTDYSVTPTKVDCGNPIPDQYGSLSLDFRFLKNFRLFAVAEYGFNNSVYSYTIYRSIRAGSYGPANTLGTQLGIIGKSAFGSLQKDPNATPLTPGTAEYNAAAEKFAQYYQRDRGNFIYPADYFTLRELSLSYDLTDLMQEYLSNHYLSSITVGFSVRNVFRASKYELDYEVNYNGGSGGNTYSSDLGTLPQPRTYNFWVKFGL